MVFPKQTITVKDPGLGFAPPVAGTPILSGIAKGGSQAVNTIFSIGALDQVRSVVGYGPLAEEIALALSKVGGPVYGIIHNSATSAALSAVVVTPPGSGSPPAITISGTPNDNYSLRVEITLGGAVGTAKFRYSLDAHDDTKVAPTWSQERVITSTYLMVNSGLTLAFAAGTYVLGHLYNKTDIWPQVVGTADLSTVAGVINSDPALDFHLWGVAGAQLTSTLGATIGAAFAGHLTTLTTSFRYARGFIDVGSGDVADDINTDSAGWTGSRVCPAYGFVLRPTVLAFEGFGYRRASCAEGIFVRAMSELISSDLSRVAAGADEGVLKIEFDGFYDQRLDLAGISTMRTWVGLQGYYIANGKLKASFGSDFTDVQYGRIMDVACRTTYLAQLPYVSATFRTNTAGQIDPFDAADVEASVGAALASVLTEPNNARGQPGHVSEFAYNIDLAYNINLTSQIKTSVGIRPLGYAKLISTDMSFTLTP